MTSATSGPACGNCGARVSPDAVTCPVCDVVLAAYQTTGGSEAAFIDSPTGSAAFEPVSTDLPASDSTPVPPPAPMPTFQRPTSMSPTADANLRAHWQMQSDLHPGDAFPPPVGPDDLSRMASGDDELADMADGEDELSAMASGHDELSAMASEAGGSFEDEVNAELAGARVVFSGGKPVIEADHVEVIDPGQEDVKVTEHPPTPSRTTAPPRSVSPSRPEPRPTRPSPAERGSPQRLAPPIDRQAGRQPTRTAEASPSRVPPASSWQSIPGGNTQPRPAWGKMVGAIMAIPFLLILCMILGVGRGVGGFMVISLITVGIIVFLLVRAAGLTGRKTTTMPRDDSLNRRK